ncbi:MAG: acyl-CoA carboxylase subunit beta [Planctomycetota bacterium]
MAKVILQPIGNPIDRVIGQAEQQRQAAHMGKLEGTLQARRNEVRLGWGEEYAARVQKKGKLTAWQRIEQLKDNGSPVFPINTFCNWGRTFRVGNVDRTSPGAGVITAFVKVHGKWTVVIANDNTVASGSWWPQTPEKIQRAQKIGLRLRLPVIYLVDSSGLYLPEQARTFPGPTGAGHIFTMNARIAAAGVPQIAGVFGDCIAGGGYMPIISDKVYMTEQAYMVIAGAALIKGAKAQKLSSLDIGGPDVHVHISNCADFRAPDDEVCIRLIRDEVATLPSSGIGYYRYGAEPAAPAHDPAELGSLFPSDHRHTYDMSQVIARLTDNSLFLEVFPDVGREMICGIGRVNGLYAGFIANNVKLIDHPVKAHEKRPGGILYKEGVAKIAQFSRACNDDGIPIVWLQDIAGFDVGVEAEKQGLLGYGSSLIYTNSSNETPMISVLLRKASGAGYYAMAGAPYDPVLQLATPLTRLAVMEGRTLAVGAFATKLDDDWNIIAPEGSDEHAAVKAGMKEIEDRITADMDPFAAAAQMEVDEIIAMGELRSWLECMLECCYQSIGYRRAKNPRIWSMHDLAVLTGRDLRP